MMLRHERGEIERSAVDRVFCSLAVHIVYLQQKRAIIVVYL